MMVDKNPEPINPGKPPIIPESPVTPGQPPAGFESYMQGANQPKVPPGSQAPTGPTPMDVTRGPPISSVVPSIASLSAQAKNAQDSLGTIGKQLNDKRLKLKRSQSHLVRQKLTDANNHIRAAGSKLGVAPSEQKLPPGLSGIAKFIAMVNDGQDQLVQVQEQLKKMSAQGGKINAGEMLSVQVKMSIAQQEISYTSTLLVKVIQSITQILGTQL